MKIFFIHLAGLILLFLSACSQGDKKSNSANDLKVKADSMRQEAINEHDRGMGGWSRIEGVQQQINNKLDSLASMPAKAQQAYQSLKTKLNETKVELATAYQEMYDWMEVLRLDSAANDPEKRMQYYTAEKLKGMKVTEMINKSLRKADSVLKTKF